jgi:hypothetical protein
MSDYLAKSLFLTTIAALLLLITACANDQVIKHQRKNLTIDKVSSDSNTSFTFTNLPNPVAKAAIVPKLAVSPDGRVVLSWLLPGQNNTASLWVSMLDNDQWTTPIPVKQAYNAVDAQVIPIDSVNLAALWMESKAAQGANGQVQALFIAYSTDSGKQWTKPFRVDQQNVASEKQNPTLVAMADGSLLAAWIDLRNFKTLPLMKSGHETKPEESSSLSLIVASISSKNKSINNMLVEKKFCDCCPPSLVADEKGGFLVYRGQTDDNVRDPALIRVFQKSFDNKVIVHNDHWVFNGCPSSGPVVASSNNTVAVAWLTTIDNITRIRTAFSNDGGQHFALPIEIESKNPKGVSGIAVDGPDSVLVAWTTLESGGEMLKLARVFADGRIEQRTTVHSLANGKSYQWPGPSMIKTKESVIIAWLEEQENKFGIISVNVAQ